MNSITRAYNEMTDKIIDEDEYLRSKIREAFNNGP